MAFLLIICLKCAYILNICIMKENLLSIIGFDVHFELNRMGTANEFPSH